MNEKIEYPNRDDLVGKKVKYQCGQYEDKTDPQQRILQMFAEGVIEKCWFVPEQDQFFIVVHFAEYKRWKKWNIKERMEMPLTSIQMESGRRFQ